MQNILTNCAIKKRSRASQSLKLAGLEFVWKTGGSSDSFIRSALPGICTIIFRVYRNAYVDKLAHLTIRVLWVLFLIVNRGTAMQSTVKKLKLCD